jgi:N-acetylglutamate synthase-like GNAT family acetyltransferase
MVLAMETIPNPTVGGALMDQPVLRLVAGAAVAHLHVRPARRSDRVAIEAMLDRTSPDTLYRRFHGMLGAAGIRREVGRMTNPTRLHRSWVAVGRGGIRGVGTLAFGADGRTEIAFLVEDDWQRSGVGRALAEVVIGAAGELGLRSVDALVQPDNWRARSFFKALSPEAKARFEDGEVVVAIPIEARPVAALPTGATASTARRVG